MKNLLLSGLIGIAIVVALDAIFRISVSVFAGIEIDIIYYSSYPGIFLKLLIALFSVVSAFAGGMFAISYYSDKKKTALIFFAILLILLKYVQVHFLIGVETLIYPISALIFALLGVVLVWRLKISKQEEQTYEPPKKHHQPDVEPW